MWNHNLHYHEFLLRNMPSAIELALDIGCGHGSFAARLAERSIHVDAIDHDQSVISAAQKLHGARNIRFICGNFLHDSKVLAHYDYVCAIASLHHLDLQTTLNRIKAILRPGGMVAILGLYREAGIFDYCFSAASIPLNFFHKMRDSSIEDTPLFPVPTREPTTTLREIAQTASEVMPGFALRRHLYWRYSLFWRKPAN